MHILYFFPETQSYMLQWQRVHIFDELERAGHTITVFNPLDYRTLDEANDQLPLLIKKTKGKFDLFMNAAPQRLLFPETMSLIASAGIPSLLICFDNLHAPFIHRDIAKYFDLVWLTSCETEQLFKGYGSIKTIFQPYAANPLFFQPNYGAEMLSVGFIGTLYDDRVKRVNQLTEQGVPCVLYSDTFFKSGNYAPPKSLSYGDTLKLLANLVVFPEGRKVAAGTLINKFTKPVLKKNNNLQFEHSVSFAEMSAVYSNLAISLNITELRNTFTLAHPLHKLHLRTFEIPMCGGLQIASYVDELAGYFEDGKEIILCRSNDEFTDKALFYLKEQNASLRKKMKENARKRAQSEHTWALRFSNAFQTLGI